MSGRTGRDKVVELKGLDEAEAVRRLEDAVSAVDVERFRTLLLEERQRVVDAIDNIHTENPGSLGDETDEPLFQDNHLADVATATFDREMASTLEDNSTHVLGEIDGALDPDRRRDVRHVPGLRRPDR